MVYVKACYILEVVCSWDFHMHYFLWFKIKGYQDKSLQLLQIHFKTKQNETKVKMLEILVSKYFFKNLG